jgi:riboflavin kinase/FMN adenylyltransferase
MRVFHSLEEAAGGFLASAVSIGNFDGVHLAHQELLRRLADMSARLSVLPSVITFHPHPATVVAPDRTPKLLTSIEQRLALLQQHGVEQVLVVPFDRIFSRLTPDEFASQVILGAAKAAGVVVGENFRFGYKQAGNIDSLALLGSKFGFAVEVTRACFHRGRLVSSTEVRRLLDTGKVTRAARFMARFYSVEGGVIAGHGIGSKQTVPTLNLDPGSHLLPARGVYVTRTLDPIGGRKWPSVTNIGVRPTFGGGEGISVETFILDGFSEPAPSRIRVDFLHRLRDEKNFPDAESLKHQILRDAARARAFHRRLGFLGNLA